MPEYVTDRNESDRGESNSHKIDVRTSRAKSTLVKQASTSAKEQLRRSTRQKNLVVRFRCNEYMAHHYVYMTRVAEVRDLESYAEAEKEANCHAAMEEEMHALVVNETWDLVDAP